jgi:hypothetical protein
MILEWIGVIPALVAGIYFNPGLSLLKDYGGPYGTLAMTALKWRDGCGGFPLKIAASLRSSQ